MINVLISAERGKTRSPRREDALPSPVSRRAPVPRQRRAYLAAAAGSAATLLRPRDGLLRLGLQLLRVFCAFRSPILSCLRFLFLFLFFCGRFTGVIGCIKASDANVILREKKGKCLNSSSWKERAVCGYGAGLLPTQPLESLSLDGRPGRPGSGAPRGGRVWVRREWGLVLAVCVTSAPRLDTGEADANPLSATFRC